MPNLRRSVGLTGAVLVFLALTAPPARAAAPVVQLDLGGVVDPFMANYVVDGIAKAEDEGAQAVLMTIDTPGGLDSSMRKITQAILNSPVPVIGFVYPQGARAASAGTFILLATNIAAMAPGTNVGAAHPVGISGAIESDKATNDAAAYIRSIAEARDRNADWAESAVRDSVSISAEEALQLDVIDLIAPDIPSLFAAIDGETVVVAGGQTVTLDLTGAPIQTQTMGFFSSLLHGLLDPNLAFIFFWLGLALIVLEFFVPGGVAGTIGALMLVSSFVAFGMLPVQLIGIVLLIASVAFFVLELKHPGIGVPAIGGIVCLVLGGLLLFDRSIPTAGVSLLVIVPVAVLAGAFFVFVVRAAVRMRGKRSVTRDETLVGQEGIVLQDLSPLGVVQVAAEEWTAEAVHGTAAKGDHVRVVEVSGLRLRVEPVRTRKRRRKEPVQVSQPSEGSAR
jgi:membrane-bound serine protease (ClpP class)